jgi:hypothetical protein
MRKSFVIIVFLLAIVSLVFLIGCKQSNVENKTGTLFNESLNQQIENLTNASIPAKEFEEFYFNYTPRNDSKYELAKDDVFTLSKGNFNSTQISFLGVMLGDSYEEVIHRLGIPDVIIIPKDKSFKNLEYNNKIGVNGTNPGLSIHLENNTVTRITVMNTFNKYLQGNTTLGQSKETIYAMFDVPDYQSFVSDLRVFHYVKKGVEFYFDGRSVNRMSFLYPHEFKGVKYITVQSEISEGVFVNITEPVEIQ